MPRASYRVQLHPGWTFTDAAELVPHLAELGVTHLYASPIWEAVAGSTHGYDVVDPTRLREELGGPAGFVALLGALRAAGLGLIVDVVPNHMAVDPANHWWWDVLEDGPSSAAARFFDIDWAGEGDRTASVLVPVLADHIGRVLEDGGLRIERDGASFTVAVGDRRLPLSPRTLDDVLGPVARSAASVELAELAEAFGNLPDARLTDHAARAERQRSKHELIRRLADHLAVDEGDAAAIDAELDAIASDAERFDALLGRQNYRLARWQTANEELDYRRFFSIETLIGVRVEDPAVFDAVHALVVELVADGSVDVLRIDHVDGLRDPAAYLERLAEATRGTPVVVEKILALDERLPPWPVEGTTGYDFLAEVDQLFVAGAHEAAFTEGYAAATGAEPDFETVARQAKHDVMDNELAAELTRVTTLVAAVCERHRRHRDHTRRELRDAVAELVASYDVYRTYWRPGQAPRADDVAAVARAARRTTEARPDLDGELLDLLAGIAGGAGSDPLEVELCLRLQQFTAPVMAKGVEDTAFYRYHRLLSLNEVGNDPGTFGRDVLDFHEAAARRAASDPASMLARSTHDTKRSGDVRARLDALSEEPTVWREAMARWTAHNERHWGGAPPDRSTEHLLYQTLVGAWPIEPDRVLAHLEKAVREAKVHTSWTQPDEDYEAAVLGFARRVLADRGAIELLEDFLVGTDLVARGRRNALAQVGLLLTSPGSPDLYQGSERWERTLTDPDNRRPLETDGIRAALASARARRSAPALDRPGDDAKAWLLHRLLHLRTERAACFDSGAYEPIVPAGSTDAIDGGGLVAYRRGDLVVAAACRSTGPEPGLVLELAPGAWHDVLDETTVEGGRRDAGDLLADRPLAVLVAGGRR